MAEIEPGRVLDSPVVERRADRLGVLEAGDRVAAEAAQPRDRLLAEENKLLVGCQLLGDQVVDLAERDGDRSCRRPS